MPYYDLNVPWAHDNHAELQRTLIFLKELGYTTVALNHTLTGKLPATITPPPIPDTNQHPFPVPRDLRLLKRCTLHLSDPATNHRLPSLTAAYDLVALRPTTEKDLAQCCRDLECDIISLDLTARHEFYFKGKTLMQAVERGVLIELCYAPGLLASEAARRTFIGNATQLIRATRGRGIFISGEARRAVGCRGPADVINLAAVWGLGPEKGKEALDKLPREVCVLAATRRKSFRGVVDVVYGGKKPAPVQTEEGARANVKAGQKRKAEDSGGKKQVETIQKPLSKREMKKREKAARLARRQGEHDQAGGDKMEAEETGTSKPE